jgi:hypothetical protein
LAFASADDLSGKMVLRHGSPAGAEASDTPVHMWTHIATCLDRRCRGAEPLTLGELGEQGSPTLGVPREQGSLVLGELGEQGATTLGVPREQGSLVLGELGEQGATTLGVPREQGSLALGLGSKAPERTRCRRQRIRPRSCGMVVSSSLIRYRPFVLIIPPECCLSANGGHSQVCFSEADRWGGLRLAYPGMLPIKQTAKFFRYYVRKANPRGRHS